MQPKFIDVDQKYLNLCKYNLIILISILLCFIAVMKPIGFDVDSLAYYTALASIKNQSYDSNSFEPIFHIISYISIFLFDDAFKGMLFIFFVTSLSIKIFSIKKLSNYVFLSFFIYISFYFLLHDVIQIRAGLAASIFLLSISDIQYRKPKSYSVKIFFAVMSHYSAIMLIPFYFIKPIPISKIKYITIILVTLFLGAFSALLIELTTLLSNILPGRLGYKGLRYISLLNQGVHADMNLLNVYNLSLTSYAFFLILISHKFESTLDHLLVKIFTLSQCTFFALSYLPVLSSRLSELVGIVLIVALTIPLKLFKNKILVFSIIVIYTSGVFYLNYFLKDSIDLNMVRYYELF
jgi:hypothetical protein